MKKTFKHNHNLRKTKKNRPQKNKKKGGTPKINFAYTYLVLTQSDFTKYSLNLLNQYLLSKSRNCDCISNNVPLSNCTGIKEVELQPILTNDRERIILVLKYNDLVDVDNDPSLLQNPDFLQRILGHCKTIEYSIQGNQVIGLYDVCLHQTEKTGYGSVLFNVILTALSFYYPVNQAIWLWLGIRLDNVAFPKVAHMYTSRGFENPYVSNQDLTGQNLGFSFIGLTKQLSSYVTNEDETYITFAKTIDLYNQTKTNKMKSKSWCSLYFTLDKSSILSLRLFPYIGQEGITNILKKNLQFESAGVFHIFNATIDKNQVIYKLSLETLAENKGIKYVQGNEEDVLVPYGSCTFHTHPIGLYVRYNVLLGTPSGDDFTSCYTKIPDRFQLHIVVSVEGIYIISLSQKTLENKTFQVTTDPTFLTKMSQNYEYPIELRPYDWNSNGDLDTSIVPNAIQKYLNWFANQNKNFDNLFELQFISWKKLQRDTVLQVSYSTTNDYCYPLDLPQTIIDSIEESSNKMEVDKSDTIDENDL